MSKIDISQSVNAPHDGDVLSERDKIIAMPMANPWRRFWARVVDIGLLKIPVIYGFAFALTLFDATWASWLQKPGSEIWFGWACFPAVLLAEAIVFGVCGNTPGKALLGLRVTTVGGGKPSFDDYASRLVGVYWYALGTGFPFASAFTAYKQYLRLKRGNETAYDNCRFNVRGNRLGAFRIVITVAVAFLVLVMIPGMLDVWSRKA